jgi:hypothetical protein
MQTGRHAPYPAADVDDPEGAVAAVLAWSGLPAGNDQSRLAAIWAPRRWSTTAGLTGKTRSKRVSSTWCSTALVAESAQIQAG